MKRWFWAFFMCFFCAFSEAENYVLYTEELPPYSTLVNGKPQGLSVEIISELFTRAELPFKVELLPWRRSYLKVKSEAKSCFFPYQRSQEREAEFHWISPLFVSRIGFYRLADSGIELRTLSDAQPYNIGSHVGSDAVPYLKASDFNVSAVVREEPNIQMLLNKRIELWATDTVVADYLLAEAEVDSIELELEFFSSLRALACNLAMPAEDIDKLNRKLKSMYQDGTIDRAFANYLSTPR